MKKIKLEIGDFYSNSLSRKQSAFILGGTKTKDVIIIPIIEPVETAPGGPTGSGGTDSGPIDPNGGQPPVSSGS